MKGSLIGRGTFGDVYLGLNPFSGELMAVKQVELPVENSASVERKRSMVSPNFLPFCLTVVSSLPSGGSPPPRNRFASRNAT